MVTSSPSPRRINPPSWLDLRLVLGIVLVLAAVLLGATLLSRANDTEPVVTVTHDLAVGTVLRSADLTVSQVRLPSGTGHVYLDHVDDAIGKKLGRGMSQGELLPSAALTHVGARTTSRCRWRPVPRPICAAVSASRSGSRPSGAPASSCSTT